MSATDTITRPRRSSADQPRTSVSTETVTAIAAIAAEEGISQEKAKWYAHHPARQPSGARARRSRAATEKTSATRGLNFGNTMRTPVADAVSKVGLQGHLFNGRGETADVMQRLGYGLARQSSSSGGIVGIRTELNSDP